MTVNVGGARPGRAPLLAAQHLLRSVQFYQVSHRLPVGDKPPVEEAEPGSRIPGPGRVTSDIQPCEVGMERVEMIPQELAAALF